MGSFFPLLVHGLKSIVFSACVCVCGETKQNSIKAKRQLLPPVEPEEHRPATGEPL